MKKIIAIILALVMLMSFAACSASSDTTETPSTTPEASTQTEENASDVEVADESENEEFLVGLAFGALDLTPQSLSENIIAICMDTFGISRKKAVIINGIILAVASLPCVFGYNIWSSVHIIGARDVLDSEDFLVSSLLLPIGSLVYLLFCVSKWGWKFDNYLAEANKGEGIKLSPKLKFYFKFILPVLIIIVLLQGLL